MTSWIVIGILLAVAFLGTRKLETVPNGTQNFVEYVLQFIRDLARTQIGEEEYRDWVPFVGTLFLFILYVTGLVLLYHGNLLNFLMENWQHQQMISIQLLLWLF